MLWFFQLSCMDVNVRLWRKLSTEELMLLKCGVGELLRVPWTVKRSNQSILKEISPGCSLEGLMWKLKLQYFGHLMWRVDSLENTLMLGGWGKEERGTTEDEMAGWHHWLNGCESEWTPGVGDGQGGLACCDSWGCKESDTTERLNWTANLVLLSFSKTLRHASVKCSFFTLFLSIYKDNAQIV